jgi:hypothetical protein
MFSLHFFGHANFECNKFKITCPNVCMCIYVIKHTQTIAAIIYVFVYLRPLINLKNWNGRENIKH